MKRLVLSLVCVFFLVACQARRNPSSPRVSLSTLDKLWLNHIVTKSKAPQFFETMDQVAKAAKENAEILPSLEDDKELAADLKGNSRFGKITSSYIDVTIIKGKSNTSVISSKETFVFGGDDIVDQLKSVPKPYMVAPFWGDRENSNYSAWATLKMSDGKEKRFPIGIVTIDGRTFGQVPNILGGYPKEIGEYYFSAVDKYDVGAIINMVADQHTPQHRLLGGTSIQTLQGGTVKLKQKVDGSIPAGPELVGQKVNAANRAGVVHQSMGLNESLYEYSKGSSSREIKYVELDFDLGNGYTRRDLLLDGLRVYIGAHVVKSFQLRYLLHKVGQKLQDEVLGN